MIFAAGLAKFLNTLNSNVWAIIVLLIGVFLIVKGDRASGESLVSGAFVLLRSTVSVNSTNEGKDVETKIE